MSRRTFFDAAGGLSTLGAAEAIATALDLDLTTLPAEASYAAGSHTIDDMTWEFSRSAVTCTSALNTPGGSGLVVTSADADSDWTGMWTLNLGDVMLGAMALRKPVTVWARVEATLPNLAGAWVGAGIAAFPALPVPADAWLGTLARRNGGGADAFCPYLYAHGTDYPGFGSVGFTSSLADTVHVVRVASLSEIACFSGAWAGEWPEWDDLNGRSEARDTAASWPAGAGDPPSPRDMAFALYVHKPLAGGALAMSVGLKALRIEVG